MKVKRSNVQIVWKRPGMGTQMELWDTGGRYFLTEIFCDGCAQTFTSDKEGRRLCEFSIVGHNTCNREQALEKISKLGYYFERKERMEDLDGDIFFMLQTMAR